MSSAYRLYHSQSIDTPFPFLFSNFLFILFFNHLLTIGFFIDWAMISKRSHPNMAGNVYQRIAIRRLVKSASIPNNPGPKALVRVISPIKKPNPIPLPIELVSVET
jgi:hypothetical protein